MVRGTQANLEPGPPPTNLTIIQSLTLVSRLRSIPSNSTHQEFSTSFQSTAAPPHQRHPLHRRSIDAKSPPRAFFKDPIEIRYVRSRGASRTSSFLGEGCLFWRLLSLQLPFVQARLLRREDGAQKIQVGPRIVGVFQAGSSAFSSWIVVRPLSEKTQLRPLAFMTSLNFTHHIWSMDGSGWRSHTPSPSSINR